MGIDAEDLVGQLMGEAGHHRRDDDKGGHPQGDPPDGDEGDQRDKGLLALGLQVAAADEKLVSHGLLTGLPVWRHIVVMGCGYLPSSEKSPRAPMKLRTSPKRLMPTARPQREGRIVEEGAAGGIIEQVHDHAPVAEHQHAKAHQDAVYPRVAERADRQAPAVDGHDDQCPSPGWWGRASSRPSLKGRGSRGYSRPPGGSRRPGA